MKINIHIKHCTAAIALLLCCVNAAGCVPFIVKTPVDTPYKPSTLDTPAVQTKDEAAENASLQSDTVSAAASSKKASSKDASSKDASSKSTSSKSTSSKNTSSKSTSSKSTSSKSTSSKSSVPASSAEKTSAAASSAASSKVESQPLSITLELPSLVMTVGQTVEPIIKVEPQSTDSSAVLLTTSDNSIIKVNTDATITAAGEGICTLTASIKGRQETTSLTLTVAPKPNSESSSVNDTDVSQPQTPAAQEEPTEGDENDPHYKAYFDGILLVNKQYYIGADDDPGGLDSECLAAFYQLVDAAAADGIGLYSLSDYRSYNDQQELYNSYVWTYGQYGADAICSKPGHSEHQTGLAIDVATTSSTYFPGTPAANWLAQHCSEYGFIIRYPYGKEYITGYNYEPWHIRYVGEKAQEITNSGLCLEEYLGAW